MRNLIMFQNGYTKMNSLLKYKKISKILPQHECHILNSIQQILLKTATVCTAIQFSKTISL